MRGRRWEEGEGGREGERGWEEGEGGREGEINLKISTADEEVNCHSLFLLQLTASHENLTPYALNLGARLTKIATASSRRFPQTVAAVFHATSSVNHVILPYSVSRRCPEDT